MERAKAGAGEYYALNVFAHQDFVWNYMSKHVHTLYPFVRHAFWK